MCLGEMRESGILEYDETLVYLVSVVMMGSRHDRWLSHR